MITNIIFTRAHKDLLIKAGIICAVFVLIAFLLVAPRNAKKNRLKGEVAVLQENNMKVQSVVSISHSFGERLHDILETLKHYKSKLVPRDDLPEVLDNIGSRAQESGLTVSSLQVLGEEPCTFEDDQDLIVKSGKATQVIVGMNLSGRFTSLTQYLSKLEGAPYAILVEDVDMKRNDTGDLRARGEPTLDINLKLIVLMIK